MTDEQLTNALAFELQQADPEPYEGTFGAGEYYRMFAQEMLKNRKRGQANG